MIPEFPNFKKLEFSDKESILAITDNFEPYSDFVFANILFWDYKEQMQISILNGNLVIKFNDYLTGKCFYTFIGLSKVESTITILLQYAEQAGIEKYIKLIPEIVISSFKNSKFTVTEDPDNLDYILSIEKLYSYEGHEFASKRRAVNTFLRRTPESNLKILDLKNEQTLEDIERLFILWHTQKVENGESTSESGHEFTALKRCLHFANELDVFGSGLYVNDKLIAFWLIGLLNNGYSVSHFEKADTWTYPGIFPYFKQKVAGELLKQNIHYINLEQDLGIPGLRQSKMAYLPVKFLKKYIVELKPD